MLRVHVYFNSGNKCVTLPWILLNKFQFLPSSDIKRFLTNFTFVLHIRPHILFDKNCDTGFFIFLKVIQARKNISEGKINKIERSTQKYQLTCHYYAKNYLYFIKPKWSWLYHAVLDINLSLSIIPDWNFLFKNKTVQNPSYKHTLSRKNCG